MGEKMKRITIDLDFRKIKTFIILAKAFFYKKYNWYSIEIRKSPSHKKKHKGYHLIIWFYNNPPKFKLRKYFHDDKNRLRIDRQHRKNKQFLFKKKKLIKYPFTKKKYKI